MKKLALFSFALLASTPFAHAWFGGGYTYVPEAPPAITHCRNFERLWNSDSYGDHRTEVSSQELAVFRARALAIAAALKAPLAAVGLQIDESSAEFTWPERGHDPQWVLSLKSSSGTNLRVNYSVALPQTRPRSEGYNRDAYISSTIYTGELPMLPQSNKRPIARVAQGFDGEGNLSSCDVIAAETRVISVTNFTTGVAVSGNMPEVIVPAAVVGHFAPVAGGQR